MLYRTYKAYPEFLEASLLVPVPIHPSKKKQRGFNQALLLADGLGKLAQLPCKELLARKVKTKSQTSLGKKERLENIKNVFECCDKKAVKGQAVILVDDVCTTTATLEECAKVLKRAGARDVFALSVLKE